MTFLTTKSKKNEGTANTVGQPPERQGKVDSFHGLLDSFYSLKIKKIPDGRVALHDWLGAIGWVFYLIWSEGAGQCGSGGPWQQLPRGSANPGTFIL